jgi:hypothetical protein
MGLISTAALQLLDREFDLSYRPRPGDTSFYRLQIDYQMLGNDGMVASKDHYQGDMRRVVDGVANGRVDETITWRNILNCAGMADDATETPLGFADGFAYRFCSEDTHADFFARADPSAFPRDMFGWNAFLLMVDAHFEFDFMRSNRHGLVSRLRRIGDRVHTADSDVPFDFEWDPVIRIPGFTKRDGWAELRGLTVTDATPCALLSFGIGVSPFRSQMFGSDASMDSSTTFAGSLAIRLTDGALFGGAFDERVFGVGMPTVFASYEIARVGEADWGRS